MKGIQDASLRWLLKASTTGTTPECFCEETEGVPWYTPESFQEQSIWLTNPKKYVPLAGDGVRTFAANSVLVVGIGTIGKLAITPIACSGNQQINCLTPGRELTPRYLAYTLLTKTAEMGSLAGSSTLPILNQERMRSLRVPVLPVVDQERIANFLDVQTARIDALIAEKERLQDAVSELFRARLGTAVVEGIGASGRLAAAPSKGFSLVREDWALVPLKHLASSSGGMTPSKDNKDFWNGDIPWVSPKDMKRFVLHGSEDHVTEAALAATSLKLQPVGSVLVVVRGMILAHTFPVATNAVPVTINQDMKALRASGRVSAEYLAWMLRGLQPLILSLTEESAHGTKALRTDQWANQAVPVPSAEEQDALVALFKKWERETNDLSAHLGAHISRLREYRSSLISAAVTGQLDLGNFKAAA